jgi:hypothetical protein
MVAVVGSLFAHSLFILNCINYATLDSNLMSYSFSDIERDDVTTDEETLFVCYSSFDVYEVKMVGGNMLFL